MPRRGIFDGKAPRSRLDLDILTNPGTLSRATLNRNLPDPERILITHRQASQSTRGPRHRELELENKRLKLEVKFLRDQVDMYEEWFTTRKRNSPLAGFGGGGGSRSMATPYNP